MAEAEAPSGTFEIPDTIEAIQFYYEQGLTDGLPVIPPTPQAVEQFKDESRWEELVDATFPPGEPHHIADLVAFLASDLSSNTTGTVVTCDGGSCAR